MIELYVQKPYTNGGVEVSQVELIGFAKTEVLDPGGEQTVTLTVKEEDLASYDSSANSGAGCYVLAGGEYAFYLASATSGAHCWSSHKGDAARCKSFSITRVEYSGDNKRSTDAVTAVNLLETADNDTGVASNDAMAGYQTLSRADGFGNNGWYAPGMNIHRTTFEGRTGEYFSEDPYITGMAAAVAGGAFQNGVYTYAKHFAFNELEANRSNGMNCVMNEQTAREIYLRPFELAIKQGKLTGMMSSFMLMNAQWNGGNFNLMHGIVRTEWGFKGIINTDLAGSSIMGAERALCAGTDMLLATSYGQNARSAYLRCDTIKETDEGICAMKTAVKHILYAYASAALNRAVAVSEVDSSAVTALFIAINVIAYLGAAVLAGVFVWRFMQERKSAKIAVLDTRELGAELPSDPSKDKDGMQ